jgi:hypothetical protein
LATSNGIERGAVVFEEGRNVSAHADEKPMASPRGFSLSFHPRGEHVSPLLDFFVLHPRRAVEGWIFNAEGTGLNRRL